MEKRKAYFIFWVLSMSSVVHGEVGYFWHVTDFHLDTNYSSVNTASSSSSRDYFLGEYRYDICWNSNNSNGGFGNYDCDSSLALVRSAVTFIREFPPPSDGQVNFIIWTGDDTSHAENEYFSESAVLDVIEILTGELNDTDGIPVYPVLGNHDFHPKNQLPVDADHFLYGETAELWSHWLQPVDALEEYSIRCGSYQIAPRENQPFRLVAVNTNLYYKSNEQSLGEEDPCGLFDWLDTILTNAKENNETVILFAHVPPGKFERFYQYYTEMEQHGFPWFSDHFNERFISLIVRHSSVLGAQLFGHHHTDAFKLYRTSDGQAVSFALLAPSVTPWRSTLAPETGANNPGLRLFKYDTLTGQILDYDQFWLNLTLSNMETSARWEREYTFSSHFGNGAAPSVEVLADFLDSWQTNDAEFQKYYKANTVMFEEATEENCDSNCRTYHYCAASELDYARFEECVVGNNSNHANVWLSVQQVGMVATGGSTDGRIAIAVYKTLSPIGKVGNYAEWQ